MEILKNISESHKAVQKIENELFNVVKLPLYTGIDDKFTIENGFGLFKENGGTQLGIVGKDFNASQPKAIFEAFCDASLQSGFDIDKLNYFEMKEGKKIRFSIPIAKVSFKNIRGVEDTTNVILNVQTGFDGNTATSLYLETYRLICTNGMKKTFTEFKAKFRNTNGNEGKIAGMLNDVTKCVGQVEKLEELYLKLNKVKVNKVAVDKYIQSVFGYDLTKYAELGKASIDIIDKVKECIEWEFKNTGASAFGLFNGITHYTNHFAKGHENSDYLFTEQGARTNDKALKEILVMVK
jgi:hypothetical protein